MRTETIDLALDAPGATCALTVHRFGPAGARPKVYIQAALHADEIPGMLAAQHLRDLLVAAERAGDIRGEIVLVPAANPIGLSQRLLGGGIGRFDLSDGGNFNRAFPDLAGAAIAALAGTLGRDDDQNRATIRAALAAALRNVPAVRPAERLKATLLGLALDADIVLDLHCDAEAVVHLYTLTTSLEAVAPLARLLGARAVLLADVSGGEPFDEAVSAPWQAIAAAFPDAAVPAPPLAVTVELRGQSDVAHETAGADAAAIFGALVHAGALAGVRPTLPAAAYRSTPLAASEPLVAPSAGILVYRCGVGDTVAAGATVAEVIDPRTGATTPIVAQSAGVLFARASSRFAAPGQRIGKIAGTTLSRTGRLLSP